MPPLWAAWQALLRCTLPKAAASRTHSKARRAELHPWANDVVFVSRVHEVRAEGAGRLAQLFDLIAMGDYVSLFVAAQEGLDPGPIPVLEELKQRLG